MPIIILCSPQSKCANGKGSFWEHDYHVGANTS